MNISTDEEITFNMHRNNSSQNETFESHVSTILIPPRPKINFTNTYSSDESETEFSGFSSSEIPLSPLNQENIVQDNLDGILYNVNGTDKKVEITFTSRDLFNDFMQALEKEITPKLNSSGNVQYSVHVQGKRCYINIQKNRSTILLSGPGNILWRDSTFRRLTASIYDQQFGQSSTPTGPRRVLSRTPQLSPIQSNEDPLALINKEISALREVLVTIQDQMKIMTGQITITHQKINTLMEKSSSIGQGVDDISDTTTQDGSCFITISQTVGEDTIMTPGKVSYSEAVTNTPPVNPTQNVKSIPAPRKTVKRNSKTPIEPKETQPQHLKPKLPTTNEQQTNKTGKDAILKETALKTKSPTPTTTSTNSKTKSTDSNTKSNAQTSGNRILISGDSILSGINQKGHSRNVMSQSFPGATVETILNKIVMYNLSQFESVVIYVGGNDTARSTDPDMEYFEEKYEQLIKYIQNQNQSCVIYLCNICPRDDVELNRTNDVIKGLSSVHGAVYIDTNNGFFDKQNDLRTYFYGERDWIHLSQSGTKRLLGSINSHVQVVENFKTCVFPYASKPNLKKSDVQQRHHNLSQRRTETTYDSTETYNRQYERNFVAYTEQPTAERCLKCGLRNHETEDCWHKAQVRCHVCKFLGHKDKICWNK